MKPFFFWLLRLAEALLAINALYCCFEWRQSMNKTHAMADVTMYFFDMALLGVMIYSCYSNIKQRYSQA